MLLRHGYAGDYLGKDGKDPSNINRTLMPDGVAAAKAIAAWISDAKRDMMPNSIYCSPIVRAVMTAKIVSKAIGVPYVIDQTLEISKPCEMLIKKICADKSISRPLLIAHRDNIEPALRRLNFLDSADIDPIAMCELRVLKVNRSDSTWKEKTRVLPSDLGGNDYY